MANRKVAIVRSLKLEGSRNWTHTRPLITSKGRKEKEPVSPDYVILKRVRFLVPMGTPSKWRIMFYEGARQKWIPCESRADAMDQRYLAIDEAEKLTALDSVFGELG
jgi:hypothetical protein